MGEQCVIFKNKAMAVMNEETGSQVEDLGG